tara:strand:+ start:144 stop:1028 length:885 start_codon:yes stop_codon:yes gene_type:complete
MKIFDCTTYYSEDLMLDVRLNILDPYVHKFIIVESKFSHSGKEKNLNFDIKNFSKFKDKIIYLVIENEPEGIMKSTNISSGEKRMNSIKRIEQSYNYMAKGINEAEDNDLICISDNDEIPNFDSVNFNKTKNKVLIFEQLFFYYKFNLFYDLIPWYGTKACKRKNLKSFSWLRNLKNKKYPFWRIDAYFSKLKVTNLEIINNGGWHFTNIKTPEDIFEKLSNFGHHNEFEESGITVNDIRNSINNRFVNYDHSADLKKSNKYNAEYKLKIIDDKFLPDYLVSNKENYKKWFDFE